MRTRATALCTAFVLTCQSFAVSIHDFDRFDTNIPFPESTRCSSSTPAGAPNFSADGYCMVGSGVFRVNEDSDHLNSGLYYVFFYQNGSSNDKVVYFTSIHDNRIQSKMVTHVTTKNGTELMFFEGITNIDPVSFPGIKDFVGSPAGQATLGGIAQGFVLAFQYSQKTRAVRNAEVAQFSVPGTQQMKILMKFQTLAAEAASSLAHGVLESILRSNNIFKIPSSQHLQMDQSLAESYVEDNLNSYLDGRYERFLKMQEVLSSSLFPPGKSAGDSPFFDANGSSRFFGPSPFNEMADAHFVKSLNALSLVPLSSTSKLAPLKRGWIQAQKFFHISGLINQGQGDLTQAARDFAVSTELSKLSANVKSAACIDMDSTGQLLPKKNSDFRRHYFNTRMQELTFKNALGSITQNKVAYENLSDDAYRRLELFAIVSESLKAAFPKLYETWTDFVKVSDKLMAQAKIELSSGNIEMALLLGELSLNALDVMSNFTSLGTAEALINLVNGTDLRTGKPLTSEEALLNTLQIIPSIWQVGLGDFSAGTLRKILDDINPRTAKMIAENAAKLDRISKHIPPSLAANKDKLRNAIEEIQRLTPLGEDWTLKAEKILNAFSGLKNFNIETLHEVIKNRSLLIQIRNGYNTEVQAIQRYVSSSKASGETLENIAKNAHSMRRNIGEKYKAMTPPNLRKEIYGRNIIEYKDELGPSFEDLVSNSIGSGSTLPKTYGNIIDSATRTNDKLNDLIEIINKELP